MNSISIFTANVRDRATNGIQVSIRAYTVDYITLHDITSYLEQPDGQPCHRQGQLLELSVEVVAGERADLVSKHLHADPTPGRALTGSVASSPLGTQTKMHWFTFRSVQHEKSQTIVLWDTIQ